MPADHQSPKVDERIAVWPCGHGNVYWEPGAAITGLACAQCGARATTYVPASLVASLQEEVDAIKDALWPWWQQRESMTAAQATERLVAEVDRLHRWKKAYAKGRAGMIASADLDHAEVERLQDRIRELEDTAASDAHAYARNIKAARIEGARQERERLLDVLARARRPWALTVSGREDVVSHARHEGWRMLRDELAAVLSEEGASDGS